MKNSRSQHLSRALDGVAIIASILLLISLSLDIVTRRSYILSPGVEELQLVICMVFVMDFVVQTMTARKPKRFFARNIVLLVVSIPYLNMLHWGGVELPKGLYILLKCLPLVRGGVGIYQLVRLVAPSRVSAILWSYITMIVLLTYLSALVFYAYEEGTNRAITDFSSALWWAGLNVTTVGAPMFAATAVGRVLTVILPGLGMILFPLLTVYVTHIVQLPRKDRRPAR